jgi:acyl-coenzyme A thioesterase PaaI-like protein
MLRAMQDVMPNQCFGCGAHNEHGLHIKSFWAGEDVVCAWRPKPHHIGHPGILYGGMIASVIDCHSIWTAVAYAHRVNGVEMGETHRFLYVTAALSVNYRKPVPIDSAIELRARVTDFGERKAIVSCTATCNGVVCADAEVVAVRMATAAPQRRKPQSIRSQVAGTV